MCCCGQPTINGQPGYSWDGKSLSTRPTNPPDLTERQELIYDEPGRCGGLDCHSHHFRVVKDGWGYSILVRHGGGDETIELGSVGKLLLPSLELLDSNARYWLLHTIHSVEKAENRRTLSKNNAFWNKAAAEKRIKTRKVKNGIKVWVEDKPNIIAERGNENGV